jgi:hypothetical protein
MHRSVLGQSRDDSHAVWHRLNAQTRGELQSLFSEHPSAIVACFGDEPFEQATTTRSPRTLRRNALK